MFGEKQLCLSQLFQIWGWEAPSAVQSFAEGQSMWNKLIKVCFVFVPRADSLYIVTYWFLGTPAIK